MMKAIPATIGIIILNQFLLEILRLPSGDWTMISVPLTSRLAVTGSVFLSRLVVRKS